MVDDVGALEKILLLIFITFKQFGPHALLTWSKIGSFVSCTVYKTLNRITANSYQIQCSENNCSCHKMSFMTRDFSPGKEKMEGQRRDAIAFKTIIL